MVNLIWSQRWYAKDGLKSLIGVILMIFAGVGALERGGAVGLLFLAVGILGLISYMYLGSLFKTPTPFEPSGGQEVLIVVFTWYLIVIGMLVLMVWEMGKAVFGKK